VAELVPRVVPKRGPRPPIATVVSSQRGGLPSAPPQSVTTDATEIDVVERRGERDGAVGAHNGASSPFYEVILAPLNPIADRAVALAAAAPDPGPGPDERLVGGAEVDTGGAGRRGGARSPIGDGAGRHDAIGELIRLAGDDTSMLTDARDVLVRRIRLRSDDYAATGGLTLLNAAIAGAGWHGDFTWKPRNWKQPR